MPLEIARTEASAIEAFYRSHEREALRAFYGFTVVRHEQLHVLCARDGDETLGAATIRIVASVAEVEWIVVAPERRRQGVGARLVGSAAEAAAYYNCHKMSALVPHGGDAQRFFERCGFHEEAVLRQHAFKLDMAVLRRFLQ